MNLMGYSFNLGLKRVFVALTFWHSDTVKEPKKFICVCSFMYLLTLEIINNREVAHPNKYVFLHFLRDPRCLLRNLVVLEDDKGWNWWALELHQIITARISCTL